MRKFACLTLMASLSLAGVALAQDDPGMDNPQAEGQGDQDQGGAEGQGDQGQAEGQGKAEGQGNAEGGTQERGQRGDDEGRGRRGRGRGRFQLPLDRLKEDLGLNDEQIEQLKGLQDEMRSFGEQMREIFRSGDFEAGRAKMQELREKMEGKWKEILTPEQFKKLQDSGMGRRMGRMFGGRGRGGDDEGGGRFGRGGRERNRARLRDEAIKALALGEEESAVVLPLLDTVLQTRELLQREGDQRRQDFLKKAREETDPEALASALEAYRTAKQADDKQIGQAQEQLREVLTIDQEAKLVGLNILD